LRIHRYLLVFVALFALSACEKMKNMNPDYDGVVQENMTPMPSQPQATAKPQYGTLPNYDYQISNASNGNVTVYSLDGAPPAITPRITPNIAPPAVASMPLMPPMGVASAYEQNRNYMPPSGVSSGRVDEQIFFKYGSSRLGAIDRQKISRFADSAKFAPVNHITVEGFASRKTQVGEDTVESHILNLKESMNRSFAVSKALMQKGLPAEKIKTISYGSTRATGNDRQDRRVDMILGER